MIRKLRLQTILTVLLVLLLVFTVTVISTTSNHAFSNAIVEQRAVSRIDVLEQVSGRMSEVQRVMVTLSNLCFQTLQLVDWPPVSGELTAAMEQELTRVDITSRIIGESSGFPIWYEIAMVNGYTFSSNPQSTPTSYREHASQLWFQDLDPTGQTISWHGQTLASDKHFVILATRLIVDPHTGEPLGLCLVQVAESALSDTYMSTMLSASHSSIYMVDNRGRVVSHSNKYMLGFNYYSMKNFYEIFQGQKYAIIYKSEVPYLFSYYQNQETGWIVVEEVPLSVILQPIQAIQGDIWMVSAVVLAGCIVAAAIIAALTTKPLKKLCKQFELVGTGTSVKFDVAGWKEISTICEECNGMMERIDHLVSAVQQREEEKRKAEIGMLQLQMHPHFLYNTLFSIRCLVEMRDFERAIPMIAAFISLLRGMLETDKEWIPLVEELNLLEQYVYVQKYRFGDKFVFSVDCPDQLRDRAVPRLLLQPLVENAILHGMRNREGPGIIRLEARVQGDVLVLRLMDNGVGMDPDYAKSLTEQKNTGNHIGISNLASRLLLYFGPEYPLEIDSGPDAGTCITIRLPLVGKE